MKMIFQFFLSLCFLLSAAIGQAAIHPRRSASETKLQELKRLAREIEILADWKDNKAFLEISQKIERMHRLDNPTDPDSKILQLRELAEVYRDGTNPPEKFFELAKNRAQLLQEHIAQESSFLQK